MSVSTYKRSPLRGGYVCRVLVKKLPGPQFGVRLREVFARGGLSVLCGMECLVWEGWQDDFRRY